MDVLQHHHFNHRLRTLIQGVDLQELSRVPSERLRDTALPRIELIELVSGHIFEQCYQPLYLSMFHGGERERPDLIVERLKDDFEGRREGLFPYRVVGIRGANGEPVGAAQFSVLMLAGGKYAVPYLQYIYVRQDYRRHDISEVLHTMVLAVATADANAAGEGRIVPFTLFETEPPNHGLSESTKTYATERTKIHTKSGSRAIMLRDSSGQITSCHCQPGLEVGDRPITLIWVIRPSPASLSGKANYDMNETGLGLIAAYYQSLRDEGFPEENIALAERVVERRCEAKEFVELSLAEITAVMYQNLENDESLKGALLN